MKNPANQLYFSPRSDSAMAERQPSPTTVVLPLKPARGQAASPRHASTSRGWLRRVHALVGVISAFNLVLLISTGFLLQHRDALRLDERIVNRSLLPRSYRALDGPEGVRADIIVTDLHSGRLFGRAGAVVLDVITLGWLVLLGSGLVMYAMGQYRKGLNQSANGSGAGNTNGNGGQTQAE